MKLENPELSSYDISKEAWVCPKVVQETVNRLPEIVEASTPDSKIKQEIEDLNEIVSWINEITKRHIKEEYQGIKLQPKDLKSLTEIWKTNRDRAQVLQNKPTEIKNNNFDFKNVDIKELERLREELLK